MSQLRPDSPGAIYRKCVSHPSLWTGLFSNRVAALLVWVLAPWRRVTPNHITFVALAYGLGSACVIGLLAGQELVWRIAVAVMIEAYVVLDCVDGQLARYTARTSELGRVLDSGFDRTVHTALFTAVAWMHFRGTGSALALIAALGIVGAFGLLYPHRPFGGTAPSGGDGGTAPTSLAKRALRGLRAGFGGMQVFVLTGVGVMTGWLEPILFVCCGALWALVVADGFWQPSRLARDAARTAR